LIAALQLPKDVLTRMCRRISEIVAHFILKIDICLLPSPLPPILPKHRVGDDGDKQGLEDKI
jgi:hypothetical protein